MNFPFGKYRGENIIDVIKKDIEYCIWFKDNVKDVNIPSEIKKVIETVQNGNAQQEIKVFPCGKYKGMSIKDIINVDISYCKWFRFKNDRYRFSKEDEKAYQERSIMFEKLAKENKGNQSNKNYGGSDCEHHGIIIGINGH